MMSKDASRWLVGVLPQHKEVANVERICQGIVRVDRRQQPSGIVGAVNSRLIARADLADLLSAEPIPDFVVNIRNDAEWTKEAIEDVQSNEIAFGFMYDLYRALNNEDELATYVRPEFYYAERLFRQHANVIAVERLAYRLYRIVRSFGHDPIVALCPAYEITADEIRTIHDKYIDAEVIFKSNPYGRISIAGQDTAAKLGLQLLNANTLENYL